MKKSKTFLIGFILLWVLGFLVIWGITASNRFSIKKAILGVKTEDKEVDAERGLDSDRAPRSDAVPVRCFRVGLTDFKDDLPVMGTVKAALEIGLKFEINGVIESIGFREGDVIYKGDLIAILNKKDVQLKVDYSKSKLETSKTQSLAAKKKHQIIEDLYEIGGIIKAKLEEAELEAKGAELQVASAEVELRSAEAEFLKTDLYAPRDGVLGSRDAEAGEFVTPQDKIATLYDTVEVFVELGIVEKDIDKIALGQDVTVTVDAYPGAAFTGTIDNVFPIIEGKSRTLTVRVGIQNPDALLLPGMFARAMITVAEFYNAIVVPSMSLNMVDGDYIIFSVDEGNTVSSRPVEVAYVTTDYTVIASGLYEGEVIVTDTPQELKNGMPAEIIELQESIIEE
ncbi:efflux RND transporter periplasmic adaptor subunit [Candidatus Omnitrophota bacterium]